MVYVGVLLWKLLSFVAGKYYHLFIELNELAKA